MPAHPKPSLDIPFDNIGKTARQYIESDAKLNEQIFGIWPEHVQDMRDDLKLYDYKTFHDHLWFKELFDVEKSQRSKKQLLDAVRSFINRRYKYVFMRDERQLIKLKHAIGYLATWCETIRDPRSYAIDTPETMLDYIKWYFKKYHAPDLPNKYEARYNYIRAHVAFWNHAMEIQGYYPYESYQLNRPNAAVRLTKDGAFGAYRQELYVKSGMNIREANDPIAEARNENKRLSPQNAMNLVMLFNKLQAYGGEKATPENKWNTLSHYAILAINHNLGYRGAQTRGLCYSWFKYDEVQAVVGGLFVNIGNPEGHKIRSGMNWGSSQFIVRHQDPRQCPIGSFIKVLVAYNDILGEKHLLNQIEESIARMERFMGEVRQFGITQAINKLPIINKRPGMPPPKWWNYRILRSVKDSDIAVNEQTYRNVVGAAHKLTGSHKLKAVGHEARNRVSNNMLELGVDPDLISRFMGWKNGKETVFDTIYGLAGKQVVCALARAGYPLYKKRIYDCPRDGLNSDFEGVFADLRSKVFNGRVQVLLERAKSVISDMTDKGLDEFTDRSAQIFLEMLDKFLIRVWLEDAAILYDMYPKSICYDGHSVFNDKRWPAVQRRLRDLRAERGEKEPLVAELDVEGNIHNLANKNYELQNEDDESSNQTSSTDELKLKLHDVMKTMHQNITIESLYTWRKSIIDMWPQAYPDNPKGVAKSLWKDLHAGGNQGVFHKMVNLYDYINDTAEQKDWTTKQVIRKIDAAVKNLGVEDKDIFDFITVQFRILTSKGTASKEAGKLRFSGDQLKKAFVKQGLPPPP